MTSPKKIAANRANAKKSTGPNSRAGKQRSSKNARRHGLSIPIVADPKWSAEIAAVAREIAGPHASAINFELAKRVAAAQLDLLRVRCARQHLLSDALAESNDFEPREQMMKRQQILAAKLPADSTKRLLAMLSRKPTGVLKQAIIAADLELEKFDRYERRALSQRKRAMRAYAASLRATFKGRKSRYIIFTLKAA